MSDFAAITKKVFDSDDNVRGVTFGRFDGEILHFEMRSGVVSLNPPGSIGKMDAEVLFPTLDSYFEHHKEHFGELSYIVVKFDKVSLFYVKNKNVLLIVSVEPGIDVYPIVKKVRDILLETMASDA